MKKLFIFPAILLALGMANIVLADEWVKCANENGYCNFSGTKKVRYGAGSNWHYLTSRDGISCNNSTFGDPKYGTVKRCYYYQAASFYWEKCANEGQYCSFQGRQKVRYGVNGSYYYRVLEDGAYCNNNVFGDPNYGIVKYCYLKQSSQ